MSASLPGIGATLGGLSGGTQTISLASATGVGDNGAGADATAYIEINSDGSIAVYAENGDGYMPRGYWCDPPPPGTTYYVRWTSTSGTLSSGGTSGTAYTTDITRSWIVTRTTVGTKTCTGTLDIATDAGMTNIIATKTGIVLTATK